MILARYAVHFSFLCVYNKADDDLYRFELIVCYMRYKNTQKLRRVIIFIYYYYFYDNLY